MLHIDKYYRGYRLAISEQGVVIFKDADRLTPARDEAEAKRIIDEWLNAP